MIRNPRRGVRLTEAQRLDWLRLIRSENVGPRTFRALLNKFGGAGEALAALPALLASGAKGAIRIATVADAEREMERARRMGVQIVAMGEPDYPRALQAIETAPPVILARGSLDIFHKACVGIVGSRNASASGLTVTDMLAREVGAADICVVSGLARGVDTRAHRASLATGTIAVLAGGHERIYPSENEKLLGEIIDKGGAAVSEMPIAWEPRGRDFPRRNRIISGLSLGVVVVEAARRSGSLITARFALEQGREVFAVPGSPLDPRSEGTNDLIRQGATLCSGAQTILDVLSPLIGGEEPGPFHAEEAGAETSQLALWDELDLPDLPGLLQAPSVQDRFDGEGFGEEGAGAFEAQTEVVAPRDRIVALLSINPVPVDDLVRTSGVTVGVVHQTLLELELDGRLERHGGNAVSLVAENQMAGPA